MTTPTIPVTRQPAGNQMCRMTNCGGNVDLYWTGEHDQEGQCSRCKTWTSIHTTATRPVPVTPATDEEVEYARRHPGNVVPPAHLIARIDAERAQKEQALRAFKAEAERQRLADEETALLIAKRAGWLDPVDHAALLDDLKSAERAMEEALRPLPSQWGPAEVLSSLLKKASRCDEAELRAEHAEARAEKAEAQNARMREVLTDPVVYFDSDGKCMVCRGVMFQNGGQSHRPDCIVAELLALEEKDRE